jgi:hypothetical protein
LFRITGYTAVSHTATLKLFGELCSQGKYPSQVGFYATGGMHDRTAPDLAYKPRSPVYLWDGDRESTETQIAQFLRSTREDQLQQRRKKMANAFLTRGKEPRPKKKLSSADWKKVADSVGCTTVLDLLYRKRIKSNYRDITTFLAIEIQGPSIVMALTRILDSFSLVNEYFMAHALGEKCYEQMSFGVLEHGPARARFEESIKPLLHGRLKVPDAFYGFEMAYTAHGDASDQQDTTF